MRRANGNDAHATRVLVAGATGYLGRHLVAELARRGHRVRALVRDPSALSRPGSALAPPVAAHVADVRIGDVTLQSSLAGVCDDVVAVVSCVGHTGRGGPASWNAVDDAGNRGLLREALRAGVGTFVVVSVFGAERMLDLPIVRAKEAFVATLRASGMPHTVVRPTGFFSDLGAILAQARRGWVPLLGSGERRLNPIHGADLAAVCADAIDGGAAEVAVGGPEVLTHRRIAHLAGEALGRRPRVVPIPASFAHAALTALRPFAPGTADLARFFVTAATLDLVAPAHGEHRLGDHFRALGS